MSHGVASQQGDCPFVITKGNRKGQICSEKTKPGVKYCRVHLRNIGVREELGEIIPSKQPDFQKNTNQQSDNPFGSSQLVTKQIDSNYHPPMPKGKLPKVKVDEKARKSAFIDAFNKNIDSKLVDPGPADMDNLYAELDAADDVVDYLEDEMEEEIDDEKVSSLKKELAYEKEQNLKAQRRINSMFTMKQCLFTGVKAVSDIAENFGGENLNGYSDTVMKSNEINALLDEMSDDFETLIGFSEMPCSVRLILTMGILGSTVYTKNITGVGVRSLDPKNTNTESLQSDYVNVKNQNSEPSFIPPYPN